MPMTASVLKAVNIWGQMSRTENYGTRIEFLNRTQQKFDWDNEELVEEEGLVEKETGPPLPGIPDEIPGVDTEGDASGAPSAAVSTDPTPDLYERARIARDSLEAMNRITSSPATTGVDDDGGEQMVNPEGADTSPGEGTGVAPGEITGVTPKIEPEEGSALVPRYPTRTRKSPSHYIPRLNADGKQSYDMANVGGIRLAYRGQKYELKDGIISANF